MVDWETIADGRVHRLKRGKHFSSTTSALRLEGHAAAQRIGKALRTVKEENGDLQYLWIQFADHKLIRGQPCPCGGTELTLVHDDFAHCGTCGASIVFDSSALPRRSLETQLAPYGDVRLARDDAESDETRERHYGLGTAAGEDVVVIVDYPLSHGERIPDPKSPGESLFGVGTVPLRHYERAQALGLLDDR